MKIRGGQQREDIKLQMVAMIDIVFQLLVFFIMTFRITALEGDFQVNMPQASTTPPVDFEQIDKVIRIHLFENPNPLTIKYTNADGEEITKTVRNMTLGATTHDPVAFEEAEGMLELQIVTGPQPGRKFALSKRVSSIGKSPAADFQMSGS